MLFTLLLSFILSGILQPHIVDWQERKALEQALSNLDMIATEASLAPQRLDYHNLGPQISARGAVVLDRDSGQVLWSQGLDVRFPVASISKLMTALVWLALEPDLDVVVTMRESDETLGGTQYLTRGERLYLRDLLYSSLVASDNNATQALVRVSGLSRQEFVERMNVQAQELGMLNSNFVEPTGLKFANIASPRDVARLLQRALANDLIRDALSRRVYSFTALSGQSHRVFNTNKLLSSYLSVVGGKTGFNNESRYNLAVAVTGSKNQQLLIVVLGSASREIRFQEAKVLAQWTLDNYEWPEN